MIAIIVSLAVCLLSLPSIASAAPDRTALAPWVAQVAAFDTAKMPPHPRLLLTPPEMQRVRQAARTPEGKPYWDAVRRYLDAERGKPVPPEPAGFTDDTWNIDDWRRIVNAGGDAQNHILAAAFGYVVSGRAEDLAMAKRWALGVAQWNPNGPTGIEGVDHPAHDILHALALAYDWLYPHWTSEEKAALQENIAARGRALLKHLKPYRYDSWNNHPWFQTTALAEAGLALAADEDLDPKVRAEADEWWRYGSDLYFQEFLPLGGRDGDWHEGTHYVSYTLIFVYQWADALRSATGINAYDVPWLKSVGHFRLFVNPPASGGIKFNDNNFTGPDLWDKMTAYNAARQTGDPVLQWYATAMDLPAPSNPLPSLYTLIYMDPGLPAKAPGKDYPRGQWYRDSGWVVFRNDPARSDDVQFGLKAGPHLAEKGSKGHGHPDQNGFLLNYLNEELAVDSGYYDYYDSPHHKNWTFTAPAHNTLLVDGKGQVIAPPKPSYVTSFVSRREGLDFSESEAAPAYPAGLLKSWRRQVLYARPDLFLVRDVVRPERPAKLDWLLHGANAFAIEGQAFTVRNDKAAMAGRIVAPEGLRLSQWGGFPENAVPERTKFAYPDQWHLTAATPEPVGDTVFVTVLRPARASEERLPDIRRTVQGGVEFVTLDGGGAPTRAAFFNGDGPARAFGLLARARALARRGDDILLSQATRLKDARGALFESDKPADISGALRGDGLGEVVVHLTAPARVSWRTPDGLMQARDLAAGVHTLSESL